MATGVQAFSALSIFKSEIMNHVDITEYSTYTTNGVHVTTHYCYHISSDNTLAATNKANPSVVSVSNAA